MLKHFRHWCITAYLRHWVEVFSPTGNRQAETIRPSSVLRGRGRAVEGEHQYSKHLRHDSDSELQGVEMKAFCIEKARHGVMGWV